MRAPFPTHFSIVSQVDGTGHSDLIAILHRRLVLAIEKISGRDLRYFSHPLLPTALFPPTCQLNYKREVGGTPQGSSAFSVFSSEKGSCR